MNMVHLGVLGETLVHSLSPDINKYLMKKEQISGSYHVMEVEKEKVSQVIDIMKTLNILGLNVTIPYKETMLKYVDELSEPVLKIGALNTIYLKDGKTYGYNTDYIGIQKMFEVNGISLQGKNVTVLGNGGAAKAAIAAFEDRGAKEVTVAGRRKEALSELEKQFPAIKTTDYEHIRGGDIIINTTPVGMFPNTGISVVDSGVVRRFKTAADIVYNPLETKFLKLAKREGLKIVSGLRMLVDQAIGSHEIWFGQKIDDSIGQEIQEKLEKSM